VTIPFISSQYNLRQMMGQYCAENLIFLVFTVNSILFVHILVLQCFAGFSERQLMPHRGFSWRSGSHAIRQVRHVTTGSNDVIYKHRDVTDQQVPPCPLDCDCWWSYNASQLTLNCEKRTGNLTSLSDEINALLSRVASTLTELQLYFTPLREIPESVCQLKRARRLGLFFNQKLTRLPDCFPRLHQLQHLAATYNGLTSLQDGLFDNLTHLVDVFLIYNKISWIGAHLFDVTANLPRLEKINLRGNQLTELDTWPVRRAQVYNATSIDLSHNRISRFTNSLGWHFNCTSPKCSIRQST